MMESMEWSNVDNRPIKTDAKLADLLDFTLCNQDFEQSDAEMEHNPDPLWNAEVITKLEYILRLRNKLLVGQNHSIQQFRNLMHSFKAEMLRLQTEMKREAETYGPIVKPSNMTKEEKDEFDRLNALQMYQKPGLGPDNVLLRRYMDKRKAALQRNHPRGEKFLKCAYLEGTVRCVSRVLPSTKYCVKHVLNDRNQLLFKECGVEGPYGHCKDPTLRIPNLGLFCSLHTTISNTFPDFEGNYGEKDVKIEEN